MSVMNRDFTGRTKVSVHDIKNKNGIRSRGTEYWVCQDLANIQRYDVAGSEAKENFASSAGFVLCRKRCGGRIRMTNVPYLKNKGGIFYEEKNDSNSCFDYRDRLLVFGGRGNGGRV